MAVGERVLPSRCFGWRSCSKARLEGARKRARRAGETDAARRRRKQRRAAAHGDDDACDDDDDDEGGCKVRQQIQICIDWWGGHPSRRGVCHEIKTNDF